MYILLRAKWLILNLIFFVACAASYAVGSDYQNNLSNLEIQKIGESSLGITIYTDAPYKEPLQVVKKSDTQYVLLLPETSNSASKSLIETDLKSRSGGLVENVDFKHFSYPNSGANNGYTKVIITTSQPVGIAASAKTIPAVTAIVSNAETIAKEATSMNEAPAVRENLEAIVEPEIRLPEIEKKTPDFRTEFKKVQPKKTQVQKTTPTKKQLVKPSNKQVIAKKQPVKKAAPQVKKPPVQTQQAQVTPPMILPAVETEQKIQSNELPFVDESPTVVAQSEPEIIQEKNNLPETYSKDEARLAFQKENFLMLAGLLFMAFILYLSKKVNSRRLQVQKRTTLLPTKRQYPKKKIKQSKLQKDLLKIMDNTNLSWQERYELLKLREADEENKKLKKTFTQNELQQLADKHSPKDDIYSQNQNKFVENKQIHSVQKNNTEAPKATKIQDPSSESEYKKIVDNSKTKQEKPNEKMGIVPQQRAMGIQGNIRGYERKTITPKSQSTQIEENPEMLAQVKIDNNKGFYLTKFASQISLIGYVGENVFVLKKFGTKTVRTLQARLNEAGANKQTYIVKVDNYKALVEVDDKMQLVLEL